MSRELYFLRKHESLSPIRTLIDKNALSDIILFFDFDQTLTQIERVPILNADGTQKRTSTGIKATQSKGSIRGGARALLQYLNEHCVDWFINTARGASAVPSVAQSMLNLDIPFSSRDNAFSVTKFGGVEVGVFRNIVSAGYDKDVACEFILSQMPPKKLLIFVDDNALNILTMCNYAKYTKPELHFKGVVFEPFLIAEDGHEASMIQLRKEYMIRELSS